MTPTPREIEEARYLEREHCANVEPPKPCNWTTLPEDWRKGWDTGVRLMKVAILSRDEVKK